jgi:hypothetical protein
VGPALGVVGNELILRIFFHLDRTQSLRLDHLPIVVLLRGAPPMQAAQRVESQTMLSGNCTFVTISEIANRPPDFSNRLASPNTFDLSVARLMTPLLITKSAKPSGSGICSM